jgi:tetratricopeptide (TPR) repeat protein
MNLMLASVALAALAAPVFAARGAIETRSGKIESAYAIDSETISGVNWQRERNQPGPRVELWDVLHVRYEGQTMDAYNGMARQLAGAKGQKMQQDASAMLKENAPTGFSADEWARIQLACRYFLAAGLALQGSHDDAVARYIEYLKACDDKPASGGFRAKFKSAVSNKEIADAGGLHRLYLDGLTGLGMAYLARKEGAKANEQAFKPLIELCGSLAAASGKSQYFDWSLRALRSLARYSEDAKDFKGAREAYEQMVRIALQKEGGRQSRASAEAQLKVGYMQILEGDLGGARAKFYEATRAWEAAHQTSSLQNPTPPRANWLNADVAYLTAGSYVGQGLVDSARAKTNNDWASALTNFSMALAVFRADDEIRSMALLGAANAASRLAELNGTKAEVASTYAKLAEKYLSELVSQLSKTKAANDALVPEIEKRITQFKGTE